MAPASSGSNVPFNVSIGIMGHVDSGKTTLAKALSTVASTAAFDKHPESKRRGITLDLGFSAFFMEPPESFKGAGIEQLQVTLVDCPGHASFVRTVIGGELPKKKTCEIIDRKEGKSLICSQIIDLMLLVIDAVKGIQTQTAESLVLAEITGKEMIVALNKIDLFPEAERESRIAKVVAKLRKTLADTPFANSPIIPVAAAKGGQAEGESSESIGIAELMEALRGGLKLPERKADGPFVFAVDHCFAIKGQGTIMTGTVLSGKVSIGDNIEIPAHKLVKKVKSMQMFRKPVNQAVQGDRAGICVAQLDPDIMEKGTVSAPSTISTVYAAIVSVHKVKYFKGNVESKMKFHVSIGHGTDLANVTFFEPTGTAGTEFDTSQDYLYKAGIGDGEKVYALLEFETPVLAMQQSLYIASKLDTDITEKTCRLAFHGNLLQTYTNKEYKTTMLPALKVFKWKSRVGSVDRLVDGYSLIGKGLFKKETVLQPFIGMTVKTSSGAAGILEGSFGQSGKFKIRFRQGIPEALVEAVNRKGPARKTADQDEVSDLTLTLSFKKYIYSLTDKMVQ